MKSKTKIGFALLLAGVILLIASRKFALIAHAAPVATMVEWVAGIPAFIFCLGGVAAVIGGLCGMSTNWEDSE